VDLRAWQFDATHDVPELQTMVGIDLGRPRFGNHREQIVADQFCGLLKDLRGRLPCVALFQTAAVAPCAELVERWADICMLRYS
jgi:hypothetical protein